MLVADWTSIMQGNRRPEPLQAFEDDRVSILEITTGNSTAPVSSETTVDAYYLCIHPTSIRTCQE
jgi:hypothetical protein